MRNPICMVLSEAQPGTRVKELMMNGEDVSGVEVFESYDISTGLATFTNHKKQIRSSMR
ncbi:hypothetical protein [Piscibacillus salipiscarius]|uniref:hypothetical protein n=1 Tax=Piscibacillus salipiscarius TaxID=299480 RepID=UPI002436F844|nr:hypothetical protein [Piscibacillus salipiscarius]